MECASPPLNFPLCSTLLFMLLSWVFIVLLALFSICLRFNLCQTSGLVVMVVITASVHGQSFLIHCTLLLAEFLKPLTYKIFKFYLISSLWFLIASIGLLYVLNPLIPLSDDGGNFFFILVSPETSTAVPSSSNLTVLDRGLVQNWMNLPPCPHQVPFSYLFVLTVHFFTASEGFCPYILLYCRGYCHSAQEQRWYHWF